MKSDGKKSGETFDIAVPAVHANTACEQCVCEAVGSSGKLEIIEVSVEYTNMQCYRPDYVLVFLAFVCLSACQPTGQVAPNEYPFESIEATVSSRGVDVPVTYVKPITVTGKSFPLVVLVLYGDLDDVVPPSTAEAVIDAAAESKEVVRHVVNGAGHGLGLFNDKPALTDEAVSITVDFLSQRL